MSETHLDIYPENKQELYALLAEQLTALTDGEPHAIPNLANCAALLFYALKNINWAGFYLIRKLYCQFVKTVKLSVCWILTARYLPALIKKIGKDYRG